MRKSVRIGVLGAVAVAVVAVVPVATALAQTAEDYAKSRRALMRENSAHMKAIRAFIKGNKDPRRAKALGTAGDVEFRAMALAANADRIPTLFARETSLSDIPGKTRAKPAIWADWNGFYAKTRDLKKLAMALEKAAATGDKGKIDAAVKAIGKNACSACHKQFRGPKPKK